VIPQPTVEEAVRQRLSTTVDELRTHLEPALAGDPEAVHALRIACRRSRALLPALSYWVPDGDLDLVAGELVWLRRALGATRDSEVITRRLTESGSVPSAVTEYLSEVEGPVRIDRARVRRLIAALLQLAERPAPTTPRSGGMHDWLKAEHHRLAKRVQRARQNPDDLAWHSVRRAAKTVRYLAEAVEPAGGKPAQRVARRAARLATLLGERQDAVVTRDVLAPWTGEPGVEEQLCRERAAIVELDAAFPDAWKRFKRAWDAA